MSFLVAKFEYNNFVSEGDRPSDTEVTSGDSSQARPRNPTKIDEITRDKRTP